MIRKENLKEVLVLMGYLKTSKNAYEKRYEAFDCVIEVDFSGEGAIKYPEDKGLKITRKTTCNFSDPENFVVLECVTRLMDKGYRPEHIALEPRWALGHEAKGGYADILVTGEDGKTLFIIECKTDGPEYKKELNKTLSDGGQLFSYWQQEKGCKWLALYSSNYDGSQVTYSTESIDCCDDANILTSAKKDSSIRLYKDAHTVDELYTVWDETYERRLCGDVIFRDDSQAYKIGVKPLRKSDLMDFSENDKIVNKFEEILRHNNVSDKENAFNRLVALFICKLVDEIQKSEKDIVDFQYKVGSDTYESLQDRLQRLHKEGMEKFMKEEIYYVSDDYAEKLIQQYTGQKRQKMIDDLKRTLRILKFYTNNDFAFKDVHNEELFYQNGKILVEVVQLFENYRIIGSNDVQMLGDLFEQLLNKGFKQNEGQFFTPIPITRFIWDSLPVDRLINRKNGFEFPKIVDYACGAGHFLTQGFEAVNDAIKRTDPDYVINSSWVEHKLYGIEKDYRLARVSKISLFMHGAGDGNIIFGDGLENYSDKGITANTFDVLVANPPYSVSAFKPHLKLKDNDFEILPVISNNGSEIETLFVERISQLLKPEGIAAVILPNTILNKEAESFVKARESLLRNFEVKAIAQFGGKTFGATQTSTIILFLKKYNEPPKRIDLLYDSVQAIFENKDLSDWEDNEILSEYLKKIGVTSEAYYEFVTEQKQLNEWDDDYFSEYVKAFVNSSEYINKHKQVSFKKMSDAQKAEWNKTQFFKFAKEIEKDKILYFSLVYNQTTLIITSPEDNKEQERFLGYTWSNRKGQEGIQIKIPGGMLYDEKNRMSEEKLSSVVRYSILGSEVGIEGLEEYYCYLPLKDMIDFKALKFNKVIRTTKLRNTEAKPGMTIFKLNNPIFEISIGKRVVEEELDDSGIPVYSANVNEPVGTINRELLKDFSRPSVLWGIDGDWMVNCVREGVPFYPTDHCGVMRIKSDKILPEYMALALQVEGKYERFSRSIRASSQRIKGLSVQIPDKSVQEKVVKDIQSVDEQIRKERDKLQAIDTYLKQGFDKLFSGIKKTGPLGQLVDEIVRGVTYDKEDESYVPTNNRILTADNISLDGKFHLTKIVFVSDRLEIDESKKIRKNDIFICLSSGSLKHVGKSTLMTEDTDFFAGGFMGIIRAGKKISPTYLSYALQTDYSKEFFKANATGTNIKNLSNNIEKLRIVIPDEKAEKQFCEMVKSKEKSILKINEKIDELISQKNDYLRNHFD